MHTKGKSKGDRFEKQMAPLFQFGRAFISSHPTPFLNHFRNEWLQFPNGIHDDVLDSVFWAFKTGQYNMYGLPDDAEMGVKNPMFKTSRGKNPALAFTRK
jgi:hypothetical protein